MSVFTVILGGNGCKQLLRKRAGYFLVNKPAAHDAEWLWACGRCELNHVDDIYKTQALNSGKTGWVIDNNSHMLYAKPERRLLQWIIAIAQPLFRGWGPPLRGGIVIWLARALRALGPRQHVIGLNVVMLTSGSWYLPLPSSPCSTWSAQLPVLLQERLNVLWYIKSQKWGEIIIN